MQEAGTRTVGQGAALLDALRKYVRTARLRHFIFTCQHSAAPASRASTFSGSCGSDCDESVHMAATRPGSRRATRRAGRDPPCIRSAVAVVMALKTNQEARMPRRSRQQNARRPGEEGRLQQDSIYRAQPTDHAPSSCSGGFLLPPKKDFLPPPTPSSPSGQDVFLLDGSGSRRTSVVNSSIESTPSPLSS